MYDDFSSDYDRFVNWSGRLEVELPFIGRELRAVGARRVLDAACGTGMHAVALAQRGYVVVGADLSRRMIERARANAVSAEARVRFEVAGFGELAQTLGCGVHQPEKLRLVDRPGAVSLDRSDFDAVLCLGNSLPHLLTPEALAEALADFAACLRPGGMLLIQNRNFDAVMARHQRWMEPQAHREDAREWVFLRFYDFEPDDSLTFNIVTLRRDGADAWSQRVASARLRPLMRDELTVALEKAHFDEITCWGDLQGTSFDPSCSPNLVVTARRAD